MPQDGHPRSVYRCRIPDLKFLSSDGQWSERENVRGGIQISLNTAAGISFGRA